MSVTEISGTACPGCLAAPIAVERSAAQMRADGTTMQINVPTVHCAGCIGTIERGLLALDEVDDVRVNLTRKRATVHGAAGLSGAALVAELGRLGYEAHILDAGVLTAKESNRHERDMLMRFGVAGFAMMNVMLLSVAVWSGAEDATRDMFHWISAAIALPVVVFSAQPFFRSAVAGLRLGRVNMDFPISLAIILAAGMSLYETTQSGAHAYFDAALSLTFFLLAGRYLDQQMRARARSAAAELSALAVPTALRLEPGGAMAIKAAEISLGDRLLVQPGARVPVDGVIEEGRSELDRSILTGESDPVAVAPGDHMRAGEMNLTGALTIRAEAVGKDTSLAALAELVAIAEDSKSRYNSLADKAARIYAPLVHLLAFVAFGLWMWLTGGDVRVALNIAVSVLIITCPCALGLAVPAVSTVASGRLFRAGVLVKHATGLERLAEVDRVILDKTGTLTTGVPRLLSELPPEDLAMLGALAEGSAHPRAQAVARAAQGLALPSVTDRRETPGLGVEGEVNGQRIRLGRAVWVGTQGSTAFSIGGRTGALEFAEELRPGAARMITALKARGLPVRLLSGDSEAAVAELAAELGIQSWQSGLLPEEKAAAIEAERDAGGRVLMIGDGLNDTAALALAHVSMAPAQAIEATRVAADFVLTAPDMAAAADALRLGQSARRRILENFGLAAVYNMIAIPIAFSGFASPLAAAIAMSTSSILVSLNALRVR